MSTRQLPNRLVTQADAKALDRQAIANGTPGEVLMQRAGQAAFDLLRECWPECKRLAIYCGGGNNGGDGYVVARLALDAGMVVYLHQAAPLEKLTPTTAQMAAAVLDDPGVHRFDTGSLPQVDVIVDGLLGIGIKGSVRPDAAVNIVEINASHLPVLALDLPSGLNGDTGAAAGCVVQADVTLAFIAVKQGLLTGEGKTCCGELYFDDLQLPANLGDTLKPSAQRASLEQLIKRLPSRPCHAHKGHFGHVLLVGGDHGFAGAILMAAQAALRSGAGLVSVATRGEHRAAFLARQPEVMVHSVAQSADLQPLLTKVSVVVAGPGLGQADWGRDLLQAILASDKPQLLDADALNIISNESAVSARADRVVTPHPGEAARLLSSDTAAINQDRFAAVKQLQQQLGGVALLKGAGTLITDNAHPVKVIAAGNPGMATGGMGDILSGIIGALMAQGMTPFDASCLGALVHALAADKVAAEQGERGMAATDLLPWLPLLLNGLSNGKVS